MKLNIKTIGENSPHSKIFYIILLYSLHPTFKMIQDEVDVPEFVSYLETKGIFTKAFGEEGGISTLFLFSCEKNKNVIFLVKLILNSKTFQVEYELKSQNEQCAKEYDKYFYENVSPLIDQ